MRWRIIPGRYSKVRPSMPEHNYYDGHLNFTKPQIVEWNGETQVKEKGAIYYECQIAGTGFYILVPKYNILEELPENEFNTDFEL